MFTLRLLLLCLLVGVVYSQKWKCVKEDEKEVDELASRLFTIGRSDRKFPENSDELKEYCKDHKKYVARLESYKDNCLKERPKQVISIIVYSIKATINNYCKNLKTKRTQDLITSAKCANKNSDTYQQCQVNYINTLMEVKSYKAGSKDKLEQFCCGYQDALNCFRKAATKSKCSEKHTDANLEFLRSYFDASMGVVCGDYNEHNDKCDKVVRIKPKERKVRPKAFFLPAVDVLATF